jgi:putative ABC transport system permease protein
MLLEELRQATRALRRAPVYTLTAVGTLGLGIAAVTTAYAFTNAFFFRPMPFRADHELVGISMTRRASTGEVLDFAVSSAEYLAFAGRNRTLAASAAISSQSFALETDGVPESIEGATVSATMWSLLGTTPLAGRTYTDAEDRKDAGLVVISERLRRRLFRGAPSNALGQVIRLNGQPTTVIGVMPLGFRPRMNPGDVWIPLGATPATPTAVPTRQMQMVARLRPGATVAQASEDIRRIARELAVEDPAGHRDWGASVKGLRAKIGDSTRGITVTLLAAVCFLLLLTCANIANLAVARVARRRVEISTRFALGAPAATIVRHQLLESMLIAIAGAVVGIAIARLVLPTALSLLTSDNPLLPLVAVDWRVMVVVLAVALVSGFASSLLPSLYGLSLVGGGRLAGGGRRVLAGVADRRLRRALMAVQVTAASLLLVGSLGAVLSLRDLGVIDLGFDPTSIVVGRMTLPASRYPGLKERTHFTAAVLDGLRSTPGISSASLTSGRFLRDANIQGVFAIEGDTRADRGEMAAEVRRISADYFATMKIPLVAGRAFASTDRDSAPPVAIVNRAFVRQYLDGRSPVGIRIKRGTNPWATIVGVVPDVRDGGQSENIGAEVYLPFEQTASAFATFVVETALTPAEAARVLRATVASVDPGQPFDQIAPLPRMLVESMGEERFKTMLLGVLAALATLVACIGIYGVTSYLIQERARELAIRMALGARRQTIVTQFLSETTRLVAASAAMGMALAWSLGATIGARVPEITRSGPVTYLAVTTVLIVVGVVAAAAPTIRASRTSPADVLRAG